MFRIPSLRIAAALFLFSTTALAAGPASAQPVGVATATESTYATVLRTINPALTLEKARAYARSVMADAWRTKLDPRFIMSIVTVESRWRANAVSHSGARGLGQLMPSTARTLGVRNAWSPSDNLRGTSTYLKRLMNHFAGKPNAVKLAIAGYNAGPKAVERYHGIPPYGETQHYVVKVLRVWKTLDTRVGTAFAPAAETRFAVAPAATASLPDEQQWLTNVNEILPATAAAVESVPNPALTAAADVTATAAPQPSEPAK
ncbi:MAG TPA: lytic transglycosylase domain-containing protein [Candidatus Elarobacter sp.]|nr:lytic transglycosylase domain-containing protein [Dongiaceae bacterium]HZW53567.1 lytic transglycosylase domain-containing protein [Candidatus Elarobacter sp.]